MSHEHPLEKAARYRQTAEYIADAALTPYLLRMAEDCERQAAEAGVISAASSLPLRAGRWATSA